MGPSSLTGDRTQVPCVGSLVSWGPLGNSLPCLFIGISSWAGGSGFSPSVALRSKEQFRPGYVSSLDLTISSNCVLLNVEAAVQMLRHPDLVSLQGAVGGFGRGMSISSGLGPPPFPFPPVLPVPGGGFWGPPDQVGNGQHGAREV